MRLTQLGLFKTQFYFSKLRSSARAKISFVLYDTHLLSWQLLEGASGLMWKRFSLERHRLNRLARAQLTKRIEGFVKLREIFEKNTGLRS